jgi:hypothetical protein
MTRLIAISGVVVAVEQVSNLLVSFATAECRAMRFVQSRKTSG